MPGKGFLKNEIPDHGVFANQAMLA